MIQAQAKVRWNRKVELIATWSHDTDRNSWRSCSMLVEHSAQQILETINLSSLPQQHTPSDSLAIETMRHRPE